MRKLLALLKRPRPEPEPDRLLRLYQKTLHEMQELQRAA